MKKLFKRHYKKYMLRPIIYRSFTFGIIALLLIGIWNLIINSTQIYSFNVRTYTSPIAAVIFLVIAWFKFMSYQKFLYNRHVYKKKRKNVTKFGSGMADFLDTDPETDTELTDEEKTLCTMTSCIFCAIIFFVIGIV